MVTLTAYRPIPEQTKPECVNRHNCETSTGDNVSELGFAASRDLLASGEIKYGDSVYVPGFGYRVCNDSMGPRARRAIDLFVYTKAEEKKVGVRHIEIYKVEVMK